MIGLFLGHKNLPVEILKKLKKKNIKYFILDLTKNNNYKKDKNSYFINIGKFGKNIFGYEIKDYNTPIERFTNISTWALDIIHKHKSDTAKVFIEGYSFGSKGQAVFQIAENCGILKYRLQMSPSMLYDTIVPSVGKKYASGKGNADKQLMYDSFKKETNINLMNLFEQEKLNNPVTDIVDSYYIAKVGYENSDRHNI